VTRLVPHLADHPFRLDGRGRSAITDLDGHVRDLLEQLLFTAPGERVNRPTFGTGLLQLVFLPNSEPLAAATRAAVQGALSQWLGDVIAVEDVSATAVDARLEVTVRYVVLHSEERRTAVFQRAAP
jgi:phage baseplate assembly protein W